MGTLAFIDGLRQVGNEHRPVAFWFMNHFLREDELRRQVRELADKGFGGFMFHGRDGLRSGYLNGEWRQALAWSLDEANQLGLDAWLYDELNYPSGPAGNRLFDHFPDSRTHNLEALAVATVKPGGTIRLDKLDAKSVYSAWSGVRRTPAEAAPKVKLALAVAPDGSVQELPHASWTNPGAHDVTVLALGEETYLSNAARYPDYLDPRAMAKFVEISYEWYAKEFGAQMGKTIKGEFTDNACFNFGLVRRAVPWTPDLPERFARKTGKPLASVLPGVFLNTPRFREDRLLFWKFLGDEFLETFVIPIDQCCERNHLLSTGHYCIEAGGSEHIRQLGDRFDQKRHQGLPAVDMLGTGDMEDLLRMGDALALSIPGTACPAYFHKNSRVMCECMGLAHGWALDLGEIRRCTGLLAVLGIDIFVPHGLYYSIAGQRKWECGPDHLHNPMWSFYREWTDWISKLSFLTSQGERLSRTALLYPSTAQRAHVELGADPKPGGSDRGAVCDLIDFTWTAAGTLLLENNISYEILDETLVQAARVEGGELVVTAANGLDMRFKTLLLPCPKVIEKKTADKLREWGEGVVALNSSVEAVHDPATGELEAPDGQLHELRLDFATEEELRATRLIAHVRGRAPQPVELSGHGGKVVSKHWRKWGREFFLLHNVSREAARGVEVKLRSGAVPVRLDLDSLAWEGAVEGSDKGVHRFKRDFGPAETLLLVSGDDVPAAPRPLPPAKAERRAIAGGWEFKALSPNALPLRSGVLEHKGSVKRHRHRFEVVDVPARLGVGVDCEMKDSELRLDQYSGRLKCFVNGTKVEDLRPGTVFDRWIFEADIAALVKAGTNELVLELSAGLLDENRGCEAPLLFGDFAVLDGKICGPPRGPVSGDWRAFGYPHYSGMASYRQRVKVPGRPLALSLGAVANAAEVVVNGRSAGRRVLPPWDFDLSEHPGEPELDIEIRVVNTPRNLWEEETLSSGLLGPVELVLNR